MIRRTVLWTLMLSMVIAWGYMQLQGGALSRDEYFLCSGGLMLGQGAATIECMEKKAWGTGVLQAYFFVTTAIGVWIRYSSGA